jgi:phospholipid/cholesterol/gamma-HCH transport system substrate-binding protein
MALKARNTLVGLFVIIGIVALGGLIIAFGGGKTIFVDTYNLRVVFPDGVEGVQQGQGVTLSGKRIGQTRDVQFVDANHLEKGVIVIVNIEGFKLPTASEMVVGKNLMGLGRPLIALNVLDPNDERTLAQDGTAQINGRMLPTLDQLVPREMQNTVEQAGKNIGDLAAALKPAAENLGRMMEARQLPDVDAQKITANLDSLVQRFDASLKSFNAIVGDEANQKNFAEVLMNARKISETGVLTMQNIHTMSDEGKTTFSEANKMMQAFTNSADRLSSVVSKLDQSIAQLNSKTGTMGLMLNDNRLYEELVLSARRLTKTLDDMREVLDKVKREGFRVKAF